MTQAMGIGKGHSRLRAGLAWLVAVALILAPVIVALSHGPAAAPAAEEVASHGHSHDFEADSPFPGHDAADHEHQQEVLADPNDDPRLVQTEGAMPMVPALRPGTIRDGPRRPPRSA